MLARYFNWLAISINNGSLESVNADPPGQMVDQTKGFMTFLQNRLYANTILASACCSWLAMIIWTTPEPFSESFFFFVTFIATTVALLFITKWKRDSNSSLWRWKASMWLLAAVSANVVCALLFLLNKRGK